MNARVSASSKKRISSSSETLMIVDSLVGRRGCGIPICVGQMCCEAQIAGKVSENDGLSKETEDIRTELMVFVYGR